MFIDLFDGDRTFKSILMRKPVVHPGAIIKHLNLAYKVKSILYVTHERITVWVEEVQNV